MEQHAFGRMGSPESFLYDPQSLLSVTLTGQIMLSLLVDRLMRDVPNLDMLQGNTDGITIRYPRKHEDAVKDICSRWENYTKFKLEDVTYDVIAIRDVKNLRLNSSN